MEKATIFQLYKNWRGQWRWRLKSKNNGKILDASTESFKNRGDCIDNAKNTLTGLQNANLENL